MQSTATRRRTRGSARSRISARAKCACWWRPTSPRAASTWPTSPTSSISSCRTSRRATCIASAARRGPAPEARRWHSAIKASAPYLRAIEQLMQRKVTAVEHRLVETASEAAVEAPRRGRSAQALKGRRRGGDRTAHGPDASRTRAPHGSEASRTRAPHISEISHAGGGAEDQARPSVSPFRRRT